MKYYKQGYHQEALHEFSKVLLVDPTNEKARYYVQEIRNKSFLARDEQVRRALDAFELVTESGPAEVDRGVLVNRELGKYITTKKGRKIPPLSKQEHPGKKIQDYVDIKGEVRAALGIATPDKVIWKEANADLNERNWRILWSQERHNTYDPAIFDRVKVEIDTKPLDDVGLDNVSAHANITVDPWSFTGKSDKFTVTGAGGDVAEFELKYWSNTAKTINEIVPTLRDGASVGLPEIKVQDLRTSPTTAVSTFSDTFVIPSQKIDLNFMPLRELWFDYKDEENKLRFFPIAYQDQALTTDDPLGISNRHTWWEESPWLAEWEPGHLNPGAAPDDFTKGYWDDSLAFFTRDSDNLRLTALRGFAYAYDGVDTKFQTTVASPKNLWQDYDEFNTYATASRLKFDLLYNLGLGLTHAGHFGFNESSLDGANNVFSADAKYEPAMGLKILGQVATSESSFDRILEEYGSRKRGNAYFFALENRFPGSDIYDQDFNAVQRGGDEKKFLKTRLRVAHLEEGYESSLATYRQTRDDEFWSRHITFRKHPLYYYVGVTSPMRWEDIKPFAIGDGIDSGRDVIGLRLEGLTEFFHRNLEGLLDIRNVHNVHGDFIEHVSRAELTYPVTDKLTTKFMGIRQDLPKTNTREDPFIFDPVTNKKLINDAIVGGEDPSLETVAAGFDYKVSDTFSYNLVWEHTNDSTAATDNYPRGLFNDSNFTTYTENGKVYREAIPFLYSQEGFPLPPYDAFNIFKLGFDWCPVDKLEFYLDFAYNEFKQAGQIDENINHYGLEVAYQPTRKLSFLFKLTYARWLDMLYLNASGLDKYEWHTNFFMESRYKTDESSEFIFQYGVGGISPIGSSTFDPFGGALLVLDTQHIFRLYYKKKF
ncbi:MAG: hypothetical protein V1863_04580 [Candidatus Omnitrophota bacterium]